MRGGGGIQIYQNVTWFDFIKIAKTGPIYPYKLN